MIDLQSQVVIGLLKDPDLISRLKRAKITPDDFRDDFVKTVVRLALHLDRTGSEINETTLQDLISKDDGIPPFKKVGFSQRLLDAADKPVEAAAYTLQAIAEYKASEEFLGLLSYMSEQYHEGKSIEELSLMMRERARSIVADQATYEVGEYNTLVSFEAREEERLQSSSDHSSNLRFNPEGRMAYMAKYFPQGIARQTITGVGGHTGVGKSIFLSNIGLEAIDPYNGQNVLYVFAENRPIEALTRLDAIVTGATQDELFIPGQSGPKEVFANMDREGWGRLFWSKVRIKEFTALTIEQMLSDFKDQGITIDVLVVDSPDHMKPVAGSNMDFHLYKGAVYLDIKDLMDRYNLTVFTSMPLKVSALKKSSLDAEDVAGSAEIPRLLDYLLSFMSDGEDLLLGRRRVQFAKSRGMGGLKGQVIELGLLDNLRFVLWSEFAVEVGRRAGNKGLSLPRANGKRVEVNMEALFE